ncbi:DnaJ domain-containing protein [Niabella sp.]|uniref:J domain-containing protein n=1 Tax=Niabella sp. TaxID=1962976 RepID=UPI002635ACDD|nr:DnaJ domain-containing protein [Niabella sp.]
MAGTLKNYYETLGVPRSATDEQIKTAYRKLILKFHPDKNVGDVYFEDWSKKVIEAFEVLSDPQLRMEYDQVYDEHRHAAKKNFQEAASRQPDTPPSPAAEQDDTVPETHTPDAAPVAEEPVMEEAPHAAELELIRSELPGYITAKQEYLKAEKAYRQLKADASGAKQRYRLPLIILCVLVIAASVVWLIQIPATEKVTAVPEGTVTSISGKFIVAGARAYFYKDPQNQVRTDEYLTRGNKIQVSKRYKNFYYAVFQSIANPDYKLKGWIKEEDLQPYSE